MMRHVTDLTAAPLWVEQPSLVAGRCWIFAANLDLSPKLAEIQAIVEPFLRQWASHGQLVEAEAALVYGHFLVIAEGISGEMTSGCSQDALRGMVKQVEGAAGASLLAGGRLFFLDAQGQVVMTTRAGFQAAAHAGEVGPETWVFDTLVQKTEALCRGRFMLHAKESWHQKLLPTVASAG